MTEPIPNDLDPERSLGATYDLDERDPDFIRDTLPALWLLASVYHRAEVRGLDRLPEQGPVLLVGNHSGGMFTADAPVFAVAFCTYFGVERPIFLLSHDMIMGTPAGPFLRKWGMMPASRANTALALRRGHTVMVFPGGDYDVYRPTREQTKIDFGGRQGFIRMALAEGAPIVPVVSIGGQENSLYLSRGEWLAKRSPIHRFLRAKISPITVGFPFGLSMGLPTIPLPTKIVTQVLDPIHLTSTFGDEPDLDDISAHVTEVMQAGMDELAAERKRPVLG